MGEGGFEEVDGPLVGSGRFLSEISVVEDGTGAGHERPGSRSEGSHPHDRKRGGGGVLEEVEVDLEIVDGMGGEGEFVEVGLRVEESDEVI